MATLLRKMTLSLSPSTGRDARLPVKKENPSAQTSLLPLVCSSFKTSTFFQTPKHTKGSAFVSHSAHVIRISQLTSPEKPNQPIIERENEIPLPAARLRI